MMIPAMLLMAILGPAPQEAPATASAPAAPRRRARQSKADAPAADAAAGSDTAAAAPASAGDPIQAGLAAFHRRRFTKARAEFERAVEADPQSAAAHYYLGYTIYKIAEPKRHDSPGKHEAAEHFAKAYELDPNFKPVWGPRS